MKAEELSPTDLRIGNIVNYKYFNPHPENPEYCYTKAIIRGVYENSIRISFPNQKRIEKVSKVYGIPLSEEVLLKCGFERTEYNDYRHPVLIGTLTLFDRVCEIHFGDLYSLWIESLHQLQNLYFDLYGEELEVHL